MRVLATALFYIFLLGCVGSSGLYFGQRKLLYPAPKELMPEIRQAGVELIDLATGRAILALPTDAGEPAPVIVFAHGNAELAHWSLPVFEYFRKRGFAILLLEYPGYGGAPGKPSSDSIKASALLAYDRVVERPDIDETRVIAYGRSIGSGAACHLAAEREVAALVLESPFTTLKALVAEKGMPAFLLRDDYDNVSAVSSLTVPVFLYHGARDGIIPISHSEALADAAQNATLVKVDCGHNDCPRPWPQLSEFFEGHVRGR